MKTFVSAIFYVEGGKKEVLRREEQQEMPLVDRPSDDVCHGRFRESRPVLNSLPYKTF